VRWCHIHKKWPLSKHETHKKIILPNIQVEHMKACMLEVYMAMIGNHFFPRNQVPLTMAQMVYAEVMIGVQVDWRTVPSNWTSNLPLYWPDRSAKANPSTPPETHIPPTTFPLVFIRRPRVHFWFAPVIPPFFFQPVPLLPVIPKETTLSTSCTQDLDVVMNNQIV